MSLLDYPEAQALLADAEVSAADVRGCRGHLERFLRRYLPRFYLFFPRPDRPGVVARFVKRRQQVVYRHVPASGLSSQLRQARVHNDAV